MSSDRRRGANTVPNTDELVEGYLPDVRLHAKKLARRYRERGVEADDLAQDGMVGLLKASQRFDPERGVKFSSFVNHAVHGAMMDGLRASFWPKTEREARFQFLDATERLRDDLGREPTEDEIATATGRSVVSVRRLIARLRMYEAIRADGHSGDHGYLPDMCQTEPPESQEDAMIRKEQRVQARKAIRKLSADERKVIDLHYGQEMAFKDIAKKMKRGTMTVWNLHRDAIAKLRLALGQKNEHDEKDDNRL